MPLLHAVAAVGLALWLIVVVLWFQIRHTAAAPPLDWCFTHFCHRLEARTLTLAGEPLPLCARCTGVAAGYLFGAAAALAGAEGTRLWRIRWAIGLIGWMGVSWLGGYLRILPERWHWERVIAGLAGGLGGYIFIACCVVFVLTWCQRRRTSRTSVSISNPMRE